MISYVEIVLHSTTINCSLNGGTQNAAISLNKTGR